VILQTTVHRSTSIKGTYNYMAPEAFEVEGIGKHTDDWPLACVIVEMRTGQRPWVDMQVQQIMMAVCVQQRKPQVPEDAPVAALLRRCFERRPTQRPTAANLADAFASDVREGVECPSPTLVRRLADQKAITEEVTRVNSRLAQDNARLQREVGDLRRQERAIQGNVRQLTQENARLTQQLQQQQQQRITAKWRRGQWLNLSLKTVVSTVLVMFVGIRLLLHCRHEEGGKSRCRDCYRSIMRGIVMCMRAHALTRADCAHKHKHTGIAGCHGRGVCGSSWH